MVFQKAFPKRTDKTVYPRWEEVELDDKEELKVEEEARHYNTKLMSECIEDAKSIALKKGLKDYQTNVISIAIALFEKRASHQVWWKEKAAKEKFDSIQRT
ncbi:hypothetical protein ACFL1B_03330 [Nanoarchaeota archaeon]